MKKAIVLVAATLTCTIALLGSRVVNATSGDIHWHINASGCVPIDDSMQNDTYTTLTNGGVDPKGTADVIVDLTCPLKLKEYPYVATALRVHFQDTDTSNTNNKVIGFLNRYNDGTGSLSVLCSVESPTSDTSANPATMDATGCGTLSPEDYFYWVRLYMKRYDDASNVTIYGAELVE